MLETVAFAFLSVICRSGNSVIDRVSYGVDRLPIFRLNLINNFYPFLLGLMLVALVGDIDGFRTQLGNWKLLVFAASIQMVAFAFSFGFRHLTVASVNVASRLGDVLIPTALLLMGSDVYWHDFLFAVTISACAVLGASGRKWGVASFMLPSIVITVALLSQSVLGEVFFHGQSPTSSQSLAIVAALMFWRSVVCMLALPFDKIRLRNSREIRPLSGRFHLRASLRALFTITAQVMFVLALMGEHRVVAWPILNAATVFSTLFAKFVLHEHPNWRELAAIFAMVLISAAKVFWG